MRKCLSVQASNEETKEHLYETLMAECRDTIQAVREELKSEAVRSDGEPSSVMVNPGFTPSFLPIRNSVRGALTLKAERCPTCSTCTGEWLMPASACGRVFTCPALSQLPDLHQTVHTGEEEREHGSHSARQAKGTCS